MEAQATTEKQKSPLPNIKGRVCNDLLLCRKIETAEKIGSIYLVSEDGGTDLRDSVMKKAEVVSTSPDLTPTVDSYKRGDVIIYSRGIRENKIWMDGDELFFLHKKEILYVEPN